MKKITATTNTIGGIVLACLLFMPQTWAYGLTLRSAESIALQRAPELQALQAKKRAFGESAIAAGQLSDPKLVLGAMNLPVNTFSLSQEPMTQLQVGLQQSFPKGHSLRYNALKQHDFSIAESERTKAMHLDILQKVRMSWLSLYRWLAAKQIVLKQKKVFAHWVEVNASMLAHNKAQQKDVLRAQLELTNLNNHLLEIAQNIKVSRAELARWIGAPLANSVHPKKQPHWQKPPTLKNLQTQLKHHPKLLVDSALIEAQEASVNWAKQQYYPGFAVGVAYGVREGQNLDGNNRPDFLSAQVSIDLPLFTHRRQDKTLNANENLLVTTKENQMSSYRQLVELARRMYTTWQQQSKSVHLYQTKLVPEAKQYAEATTAAYQNAQTDFPTLARAYVLELDTELAELTASINQSMARINLLYLQGK